MHRYKNAAAGLIAALLAVGLGCESDYTLGDATQPSLGAGDATPTPAGQTPPDFEATPTSALSTPEPGGWATGLRVEPPSVELGLTDIGCERAITLLVTNVGSIPLDVTNIRRVGATTAWDIAVTDDLEQLGPGESGHIWVNAEATAIGVDSLLLQVNVAQASAAAAEVPVSGEVREGEFIQTDTYFQEPRDDVDVLWVIDNSTSMGDEQEAVAINFDAFMNFFVPIGIKYHMGVVTTDMLIPTQSGQLQGTYGELGNHFIDWTMKETGDDALRKTIKTLGTDGSPNEQGLEAMQTALSPDLLKTRNAGFLRQDASLAVIIVSDENDGSLGSELRPNYWQDYVDFLIRLKGGNDNVVCSSIIDWDDTGGYAQVAYATGGEVEAIQSDFYQALVEIGRVSAGYQDVFDLSSVPTDAGEIVVTINGEEVPPGEDTWAYDAETGAINFAEDTVPQDGDRVDITYLSLPICEL